MLQLPHNSRILFLFDPVAKAVIDGRTLDYRLGWYHPGKVVAVVPLRQPETTYLVDLEENGGSMSCTCDAYLFHRDPSLTKNLGRAFQPCRHITLAGLILKHKLLPWK